jgi:hypothetical protein
LIRFGRDKEVRACRDVEFFPFSNGVKLRYRCTRLVLVANIPSFSLTDPPSLEIQLLHPKILYYDLCKFYNSAARVDASSDIITWTPTFHAWSRLPTELKLEILSHLLKQSNSIGRLTHMWNLGAILGTRNRELVTLGLEACYSINELVINSAHLFHHGTSIRFPPLAYGKLVRNIQFEMRCSMPCVTISTDHYFVNKRNGWQPFFKKMKPPGTGSEYTQGEASRLAHPLPRRAQLSAVH